MFKEKLRELRKKNGKTQAQLGDLLGVTQQAIERWENGRTEPGVTELIKLSRIFGVSVDYLLDNSSKNILELPDGRLNIVSAVSEMYARLELHDKEVIDKYVDSVIRSMGYVKISEVESSQEKENK